MGEKEDLLMNDEAIRFIRDVGIASIDLILGGGTTLV